MIFPVRHGEAAAKFAIMAGLRPRGGVRNALQNGMERLSLPPLRESNAPATPGRCAKVATL